MNENESGASEIDLAATNLTDRERDFGDNQQRTTIKSLAGDGNHNPIVREIKKHRRKQKSNIDSSENESSSTPSSSIVNQSASNSNQEIEIPIKFRLSNGKEHRLYCKPNEKVRNLKRRLAMLENGAIDSQTQRLYFGGKLLRKFLSRGGGVPNLTNLSFQVIVQLLVKLVYNEISLYKLSYKIHRCHQMVR
jgi:hypothetical protein